MTKTNKYLALNETNFENEVLKSDQPVVVDFWADWCGPCKALAPTIAELATDYDGKAKIAKVDVDENPGLAAKYGIRSIPAVLYFKEGNVVDTVVGLNAKSVFSGKLDSLVDN